MADLFPSNNQALITTTTAVTTGSALPCRGYNIVVADVTITDTAQVNFQASADGGTTYRYIIGAPTVGTAASVSATASGHFRFNVAGMDYWRPVAATVSVGAVQVTAIAQSGGTDNVVAVGGGSAVTQSGGWDVRLIASTPTIGTVNSVESGGWDIRLIASTPTIGNVGQAGGWDVRLIAGTATAATVTAALQRSSVVSGPNTIGVGTFASPTLAANALRKSLWFQNVGTQTIYLGLGATPTATSYHFALASGTNAHTGDGGAYFDSEWLGAVLVIAGAATGNVTFGETT